MSRSTITILLLSADVGAAVLALVAAFVARFHAHEALPPLAPYLTLLPAVALVWPAIYTLQGLYRPARGRTALEESFSLAFAIAISSLVLFGADAYFRLYQQAAMDPADRFQYSRVFLGLFILADLGLNVAGRALVRRRLASLRRRGVNARRLLVVGAGGLGRNVASAVQEHPEYGYHVVGFTDDDPAKKGTSLDGLSVLGTSDDVIGLVSQERVDEILVALPWSAHDRMLRLAGDAAKEGINIKLVPDLLQYVAVRAGFEDLAGIPLLNLSDNPLGAVDRFTKRTFDIVASAAALVALSPLLAGIAILVRRSSPGSILYRQERLGLDGKRFTMHKFRTMRSDAEAATGPVFAADDDPRATELGRTLRRLSFDELPQLWNVLKGDMSLVGPRPERPSFAHEFKEQIPDYMQRHRMRSGVTGWAQVNGWRGNTSIEKRIEYDLYYLRNWSLRLDIKILALTLVRGIRWRE